MSVAFRPDAGGISRVARLMSLALPNPEVHSLYGEAVANEPTHYYQGKRWQLIGRVLARLMSRRHRWLIFDHLGVASLLALWPRPLPLPPTVVFLHDEEAWQPVVGRHRRALQRARLLLCNSDYTYQRFVRHNPAFAHKTRVCLLGGVPASFYQLAEGPAQPHHRAWLADSRPYVLFVSRLWQKHAYKGHWQLLSAFAQLAADGFEVPLRLALIGRGDDVPAVRAFIAAHQLDGHVTHFDDVDDAALPHFYRQCRALVFPSSREGFGFVFLEAMYWARACVGLRAQPAEEIILEGQTGRLLADNQPATLGAVLADIAQQPTQYEAMGAAGRQHYDAHFTGEHFRTRFLAALAKLEATPPR